MTAGDLAHLTVPLCWPTPDGACGCGWGHLKKAVGKVPLVPWERFTEQAPTAEEHRAWAERWPHANRGLLLGLADLLVIDVDSDAALGEATALRLPLAPVIKTAHGRHYLYRRPPGVAGRTTRRGQSRAIDVLAAGLTTLPPSRHRTGVVYEWIVLLDHTTLSPAPAWAVEMLATAATSASTPVALDEVAEDVALDTLPLSPRTRALIREGHIADLARYPSRSEALFAVLQALIRAGCDDATIAGVLLDERYAISAKPRELGRRWLAREIGRARAKCRVVVI